VKQANLLIWRWAAARRADFRGLDHAVLSNGRPSCPSAFCEWRCVTSRFFVPLYIVRAPSLRNPWIFPRVDFAVVVLDWCEAPKVMRPLDSYCVVPYLDLSPESNLRPFLC
jgi:hypothetical protein